jgi:hypothetical protein
MNKLRGLFNPVRLGQVRIATKSSKIEAPGSPIHLLYCFGRQFEKTIFKRTALSSTIYVTCLNYLTILMVFHCKLSSVWLQSNL